MMERSKVRRDAGNGEPQDQQQHHAPSNACKGGPMTMQACIHCISLVRCHSVLCWNVILSHIFIRFLLVIMAKRLLQFRGRRRAQTADRVFQPRAFHHQQCKKPALKMSCSSRLVASVTSNMASNAPIPPTIPFSISTSPRMLIAPAPDDSEAMVVSTHNISPIKPLM